MRKIIVNNEEYRWKIGKRFITIRNVLNNKGIHMTIEAFARKMGCMITVTDSYDGWTESWEEIGLITPKNVSEFIKVYWNKNHWLLG